MTILTVQAGLLVCSLYDQFRSSLGEVKLLSSSSHSYPHRVSCVLLVSLCTNFSEHGYGPDGNTEHGYGSKNVLNYVHFLLAGNVHVWAYVGPELDPFKILPTEWKNTSNNNSCWRSGGVNKVLDELYFRSCGEVQSHLPEELRVAPKDVSKNNNMGSFLGENIFFFADIEFKPVDSYLL